MTSQDGRNVDVTSKRIITWERSQDKGRNCPSGGRCDHVAELGGTPSRGRMTPLRAVGRTLASAGIQATRRVTADA